MSAQGTVAAAPNPYPSHTGRGLKLYRCDACRRLVAPWHIEAGACRCGGRKIRPAEPRWWEVPTLCLSIAWARWTRPAHWKRYLEE